MQLTSDLLRSEVICDHGMKTVGVADSWRFSSIAVEDVSVFRKPVRKAMSEPPTGLFVRLLDDWRELSTVHTVNVPETLLPLVVAVLAVMVVSSMKTVPPASKLSPPPIPVLESAALPRPRRMYGQSFRSGYHRRRPGRFPQRRRTLPDPHLRGWRRSSSWRWTAWSVSSRPTEV